jgi:hypothetical protein
MLSSGCRCTLQQQTEQVGHAPGPLGVPDEHLEARTCGPMLWPGDTFPRGGGAGVVRGAAS